MPPPSGAKAVNRRIDRLAGPSPVTRDLGQSRTNHSVVIWLLYATIADSSCQHKPETLAGAGAVGNFSLGYRQDRLQIVGIADVKEHSFREDAAHFPGS